MRLTKAHLGGSGVRATILCGLILAAFAALSYSAVRTKAPTIDEPLHLASGLVALRLHDLRVDPPSPPAWKVWAALGDVGLPVRFDRAGPLWADLTWHPVAEMQWSTRTLFATPGTDGPTLVNRGRAMMLVLAVAAAAIVARWSYELAGPVAAVVAAGLFCFDPTVLAHGPIIKSDVPLTLAWVAVGWLTWRFGRRASIAGAVGLGLACGAAVSMKFSGLLVGPAVVLLLAIRAVRPWPRSGGQVVTSRKGRAGMAITGAATAAVVAFAVVWAGYGFRYRPAPSPTVRIDLPTITARARLRAASEAMDRPATAAEAAAFPPGLLDRFVHWADDHHALPQAMAAGLLQQATNVTRWPAFLDGRAYDDGRAAYYPLAAAYKTPLPTLAAIAVVILMIPLRRRWAGAAPVPPAPDRWWGVACVAIPTVLFAVVAMRTPVNIGLRSVLPIYPAVAITLGSAAAWAWRRRPRATAALVGVTLGSLACSAVAAWPDYLSFFNAAVGGTRGGFAHLADSNLDWGQDLTALADWHRDHPGTPIYGELFTTTDPSCYGLHVTPLWSTDAAGVVRLNRPPPGAVIAVSATHLRGLYVDAGQLPLLTALAARPPRAVLHGTIYLYDVGP